MIEIKIAHSGDWHLMQSQYGRIDRAEDFRRAARNVIKLAVAHKADVVVLAGDLFHKCTVDSFSMDTLSMVNADLEDAGLDMLTISGNHDLADPSWFDVFNKIIAGAGKRSRIVPLTAAGVTVKGFLFKGYDFSNEEVLISKLREDKAGADMLVLHQAVDVVCDIPDMHTFPSAEIPLALYPAVACADIHIRKRADITTPFGLSTLYMPGSIEQVRVNEPIEKSLGIWTLRKQPGWRAEVVSIEEIDIPDRRPVIPLRIATEQDLEAALVRLRPLAEQDPIVWIAASPGVEDVSTRVANALVGGKPIIRCRVADEAEMPGVGQMVTAEQAVNHMEALRAVYDRLVNPAEPWRELGVALLTNPDDAVNAIGKYINAQISDTSSCESPSSF